MNDADGLTASQAIAALMVRDNVNVNVMSDYNRKDQ